MFKFFFLISTEKPGLPHMLMRKIQLNILASVLVKRVNYHEAPRFYRLEKCPSKVLLGDGEMVGVWRGGT